MPFDLRTAYVFHFCLILFDISLESLDDFQNDILPPFLSDFSQALSGELAGIYGDNHALFAICKY